MKRMEKSKRYETTFEDSRIGEMDKGEVDAFLNVPNTFTDFTLSFYRHTPFRRTVIPRLFEKHEIESFTLRQCIYPSKVFKAIQKVARERFVYLKSLSMWRTLCIIDVVIGPVITWCSALTDLSITHAEFENGAFETLCTALSTSPLIKSLDLSGVNVAYPRMKMLVDALKVSNGVAKLVLVGCNIHDSGAEELSMLVGPKRALRHLDLTDNEVAEKAHLLVYNSGLTDLILNKNILTPEECVHILINLKKEDTTLRVLEFSENRVSGRFTFPFVNFQGCNRTLERLCVSGIQFSNQHLVVICHDFCVNGTLRHFVIDNDYEIQKRIPASLFVSVFEKNRTLVTFSIKNCILDSRGFESVLLMALFYNPVIEHFAPLLVSTYKDTLILERNRINRIRKASTLASTSFEHYMDEIPKLHP